MSADEHLVETRREITSVEQYIASKNLPVDLQDEVRDIFEFKSRQVETGVSEAEETAIFRGLSQTLQVEVAQYIGRKPIARTQTFKGCDDNFLDILSTHLREVTVPPGAVLYNTNDISKQLHIIFSGVVELVVRDSDTGEEVVDGRHTDGDVLAPLPFFFNVVISMVRGTPSGPNPWRALTPEWLTSSPPPVENWKGAAPLVHEPYGYGGPPGVMDLNQASGRDLWRNEP